MGFEEAVSELGKLILNGYTCTNPKRSSSMANEKVNFVTPVGRLLQGDPAVGNTVDRKTGKPLTDKAGNPKTSYYLALGIPKTTNGQTIRSEQGLLIIGNPVDLINMLRAEGKAGFPGLFDVNGNCVRQDFAFKYIDGDSTAMNQDNKRWCDIEGFPGHWVFKFNTTLPIDLYDMNNGRINPQASPIKRGHYIRVLGNMAAGTDATKPSVFLNPSAVMHVAYGPEITGFDTSSAFAGLPPSQLPAGASTVPVASASLPAGVTPVIPQYAPPATQYAPPVQSAAPGPVVQPVASFLTPPAPVAPPPVAETRYSVNGAAYTRSQLLAMPGWTEAHLAGLQVIA
jgi:hypothetical protein